MRTTEIPAVFRASEDRSGGIGIAGADFSRAAAADRPLSRRQRARESSCKILMVNRLRLMSFCLRCRGMRGDMPECEP